jgi:hypothetical protein
MPVVELTDEHFQFANKILCVRIPKYCVVLFKLDGCGGCNTFFPIYNKLSTINSGIHFTILNLSVDSNKKVGIMSRNSSTPIEQVPHIIFYVDGKPKAVYRGRKNLESFQSFLSKAIKKWPASEGSSFMPSYSNPPNRGQAGFSRHPTESQRHVYMPDVAKPNASKGGYAVMGGVDEDDDEKLLIPDTITPHNVPWEGKYADV